MSIILAMGAHFDDIEVGIGGTLLKHIENNDKVHIAILNSDEFRTGDPMTRQKEQLDSLQIMGLNCERLIIFNSFDRDDDVIAALDKVSAEVIYISYEKDTHQAHRRVSRIGQSVARKKYITMLFYDCGSTYGFRPNLFSIIDFNKKAELIKCFSSQVEIGSVKIDIVRRSNSYLASLVSEEPDVYAEGFMVRRMIYEV